MLASFNRLEKENKQSSKQKICRIFHNIPSIDLVVDVDILLTWSPVVQSGPPLLLLHPLYKFRAKNMALNYRSLKVSHPVEDTTSMQTKR